MKDLFLPLKVSATGLEAQKIRLNVIASNLSNINSTRTPEGGPYRRKDVLFMSYMYDQISHGVDVYKIVEDQRPFRIVFEPGHPDADKDGYVRYPNVNPMEEMINMISASRAYEANLTMINSYKEMFLRTLDLLKV
ncbi:MAG: flagellar basal body rod protein FlgC [Thermodesulfovibrio sp.]|uniref:flagellar basal body rod protein FlgC n=1 Tax=unclassified Thermodesulfovibrio TaxID=2645936 RepID=UPI00083A1FF6|nr:MULTISPECIES: flagellar basal body rod protein FlgC [unclassified Thermodesulfovibrio]MDI1470934.1 flagellar basal body rod protein FlgC [Thermodesulfovibrio sp. 1176]MDI6713784.1 flagellar basal body rod protein FlgC [Thermodesulfovibrio sp.]ODA45144.1 Flagellar basal-body rod protein FlgC [Thermodesulfovibrio sp. N1]